MPRKRLELMGLWLTPGMGVKRHLALLVAATLMLTIGFVLLLLWFYAYNQKMLTPSIKSFFDSSFWLYYGNVLSIITIIAGLFLSSFAIARLNNSLLSHWKPLSQSTAHVISQKLNLSKGPKIVALGGGTGLSNLLRGIRKYSSNITAVVAVSDDGGSSGRLRTAFDMPAPGDINDCLAALSDYEDDVSALLEYRFTRGKELQGHSFGNLMITTLTEVEGNFAKAIKTMNSILNITGSVYPATQEAVILKARKASGKLVVGESQLAKSSGAIQKVAIEPSNAKALSEVTAAILDAELIILGPGSLFTSTIPPLLVKGIKTAINDCQAELIYISNIMTEVGETDGMSTFDHIQAIYEHLGCYPDRLILNSSPIDKDRLELYQKEGAEVVNFDESHFKELNIEISQLPILGHGQHAQHDSDKLAEWLANYAKNHLAKKGS